MFRTEGTPAYLRRKIAGETLALRAGRQTARSNVQLARVQGQQLSQTESRVAEKISWSWVALAIGVMEGWSSGVAGGEEITVRCVRDRPASTVVGGSGWMT